MYVPKHFEENREKEIKRIIESFPLAILVANTKNGLVANHLPLLLNKSSNGKKVLIGHIAKNNTLHRELRNNDNVMVIFKSEDAYISPNWYPTRNKKREHVPEKIETGEPITWEDHEYFINSPTITTESKKYSWMNDVVFINKVVEVQLNNDKKMYVRYNTYQVVMHP